MIIRKLILIALLLPLMVNAQIDQLNQKINKILSRLPSSTNAGILIYDPITRDTLFSLNSLQSMIPASNTKIFTTAAALSLLGTDFSLATRFYTDDHHLQDGVIDGNLYIKGLGNPLFSENDLLRTIDRLKEIGIEKITGNIVADDTYFDDVYSRSDWIPDEKANVTLPPVSALIYENNKTVITRNQKKRSRHYSVNIDNPPIFIARIFRERLINRQITVEGISKSGITPLSALMFHEVKVPLIEVIKFINKNSDNFMAECLFKTIGAETSGKQGNSFYSQQAVLGYISDNAIYSAGTALVDGSGISRFDQVTVSAIVGVLENMYFDLSNFEAFYNSLSIAGIDGTLRNRFHGTFAQNNFRGKTGTLNGVSSLSGYLTTKEGDDLIIAIIFEFSRGGASHHKNIQDDLILVLTEWKSDLSLKR